MENWTWGTILDDANVSDLYPEGEQGGIDLSPWILQVGDREKEEQSLNTAS